LIQYKAEVMLRIFEEKIIDLIDGKAKAMVVATSRIAGLRYFNIFKEKLLERKSDYKVLYAFSPFVHPETNEAVTETGINNLNLNEAIEDRFEAEDYRLLVVANKFQAGFDQPLLAGMFLDKGVVDHNAVQTVSRLNRCHENKDEVVVVDFTNNAKNILKAFKKYRRGTPFEPEEPDKKDCITIYESILSKNVFDQADADHLKIMAAEKTDAEIQQQVAVLRTRFQKSLNDFEERKSFVYQLAKLVKVYYFMTGFFQYPPNIISFVFFAELVGPQMIKKGSVSDLMKQIRKTTVVKANVTYVETVRSGGPVKISTKGRKGSPIPVKKITIQDAIEKIRNAFTISEEEAIIIRDVTEEKMKDEKILDTIRIHKEDVPFIRDTYKEEVDRQIQQAYEERDKYEALWDPKYTDDGAIFDIMAFTVIESGFQTVMAE